MSAQSLPSGNRRVTKKAGPPVPPVEGGCHFYIPKKNRYCKMVPGKNQKYCGEHIMNESGNDLPANKLRVPCPIDPSHTCFQNQLKKHLAICNARLEDQPPGFIRNVNAGPENLEIPEKISINDLSPSELKAFIDKVVKASDDDDFDDRLVEFKEHLALKEELSRTDLSEDGALKHARQQASILGHMEAANLLTDGNCFVEMGAGRGHVNHWIQRALGNDTYAQFVLVDRQGVRYKMDAQHRDENEGPKFHRLRMDIQHLRLSEVPEIVSRGSPVVVVSKHLCGAATDLTLRCCVSTLGTDIGAEGRNPYADFDQEDNSYSNSSKSGAASSPIRVIGVVIALCCHHRVEYRSYVGHSLLRSRGFEPRDFWLLRSLSSWATCGFDQKKAEEEEGEQETRDKDEDGRREDKMNGNEATAGTKLDRVDVPTDELRRDEATQQKSHDFDADESSALIRNDGDDFKKQWEWYYRMTVPERSGIGRRCKRLLDTGRIDFIKSQRPKDQVRLVKYVDASTSLENFLLLVHEN